MSSTLATPPYSSGESPTVPIIIPPPSFDINNAHYQRPLLGFANEPAFLSYQTAAEFTAVTTTSPDVVAIAGLFGALKHTMATLSTMFGEIGNQTEKIAALGPATKAAEQIKNIRAKLGQQIQDQEASMQEVRHLLESTIQENLIKQLKHKIYDTIRDTISRDIKARVQRELIAQIPEHLRRPTGVQTHVLNPKAPSHEVAVNGEPSPTAGPLQPMLRPLPTPAQSPARVVNKSRLSVDSTNASPISIFLTVPAPTPVVTSATLTIPRPRTFYPSPSPLGQREPLPFLSISTGGAKRLFIDYRRDDECAEDSQDRPTVYPQSDCSLKVFPRSPQMAKPLGNLNSAETREFEIDRFTLPIGVPILMVPAPNLRGAKDTISLSLIDPSQLLASMTSGKGTQPEI